MFKKGRKKRLVGVVAFQNKNKMKSPAVCSKPPDNHLQRTHTGMINPNVRLSEEKKNWLYQSSGGLFQGPAQTTPDESSIRDCVKSPMGVPPWIVTAVILNCTRPQLKMKNRWWDSQKKKFTHIYGSPKSLTCPTAPATHKNGSTNTNCLVSLKKSDPCVLPSAVQVAGTEKAIRKGLPIRFLQNLLIPLFPLTSRREPPLK